METSSIISYTPLSHPSYCQVQVIPEKGGLLMEANTLYQVQEIYNKSCFLEHTNFFLKMLEKHLRDVFIDLEQCALLFRSVSLSITKQSKAQCVIFVSYQFCGLCRLMYCYLSVL